VGCVPAWLHRKATATGGDDDLAATCDARLGHVDVFIRLRVPSYFRLACVRARVARRNGWGESGGHVTLAQDQG
jgi:hypothetical protein